LQHNRSSGHVLLSLPSVPSLIIAAVAALGSTFADYAIFRFFRDSFFTELQAFLKEELKVDLDRIAKRFKSSRLLNSRFGRKIVLPALAAAIIASPLPDEIGISLLASQKMESKKFLPISFTLNLLRKSLYTIVAKEILAASSKVAKRQ